MNVIYDFSIIFALDKEINKHELQSGKLIKYKQLWKH